MFLSGKIRQISGPAILGIAASVSGALPANAMLSFYIYQLNPNTVKIETSGFLSGLQSSINTSICNPAGAYFSSLVCTGPSTTEPVYPLVLNGPLSPFSNTFLPADTVDGIAVGLDAAGALLLDDAYIEGTPIVSSSTYNNQTLGSLGLTSGQVLGQWLLSPQNATPFDVRVVVGPPPFAAVPGPLPALGAAAAFGFSRRLRKRIARRNALPVVSAID